MEDRAGRTTALILSRIVAALFSFGGGIILARALTMTDYATYSQIMLIGSSCSVLTVGLQQSLFYFVPLAPREERRNVAFRGLFSGVMVLLVVMIMLFVFRERISGALNNEGLSLLVLPLLLYVFFFSMSGYNEALTITFNGVEYLAVVNIVTSILIFGFIAVSAAWTGEIQYIVTGVACCHGFSTILCVSYLGRRAGAARPTGEIRMEAIKGQIAYALPITMSSVLGIVGRRVDQYLISTMFNPEQYAIYARGAFNIPFVDMVTYSVFLVLLPEFTALLQNQGYRTVLEIWRDSARRIALLLFPVACFFVVMAEPFMVSLFSEKFAPSAAIFRIYAFALILNIAVYGTIARACGRPGIIYKTALILAGSNLFFNAILISLIGPIGAASGTLMSNAVAVYYSLRMNAKLLGCGMSEIMPWRQLSRIALASISTSIVLLPFIIGDMNNLLSLSIGCLCYGAVLFWMYFKFHLLTSEDRQFLNRVFGFVLKSGFPGRYAPKVKP